MPTFQVATVKYRHWLSALHQFSQSQCILLSSQQHTAATTCDLITALCRASAIIYDAMMLAKVGKVCVTVTLLSFFIPTLFSLYLLLVCNQVVKRCSHGIVIWLWVLHLIFLGYSQVWQVFDRTASDFLHRESRHKIAHRCSLLVPSGLLSSFLVSLSTAHCFGIVVECSLPASHHLCWSTHPPSPHH